MRFKSKDDNHAIPAKKDFWDAYRNLVLKAGAPGKNAQMYRDMFHAPWVSQIAKLQQNTAEQAENTGKEEKRKGSFLCRRAAVFFFYEKQERC